MTDIETLKAKIEKDGDSSFGPSTVDVRNLCGIYEASIATLTAERDVLREALAGIKWRSTDKDNMEFSATITCFQMDALLAARKD